MDYEQSLGIVSRFSVVKLVSRLVYLSSKFETSFERQPSTIDTNFVTHKRASRSNDPSIFKILT